ncbi:MAG: hypothetical protein HYT09_00875 [Candidatus Levybacteria bacterium]|nr:hypothetical protein [Candidatus Levybacteria bacterium]
MKIYIFGAGASFGSQNNEFPNTSPSRAPLIDEIFDPRYQPLSLYMLSPSELDFFRQEVNKREDKSVEKWLESQWNAIKDIKVNATKNYQTRLFGHKVLYLWNVMRSVSNSYSESNVYRSFLSNLRDANNNFGLISFNYDTLLDRAYQDIFGNTFITIENYLEENFVKPHGSVNWLLEKRDTDPTVPHNHDTALRIKMAMNQFFMNGSISLSKLQVIDPSLEQWRHENVAVVWERLGRPYFYPLIFMPLAQKDLSHINDFYEQVIGKAREMLMQAEEIYIIGYRARDEIIKELLKFVPKDTPLHVVSDTKAIPISNEIRGWATNLKEGSMINGGFAEFNRLHFKKPGEF